MQIACISVPQRGTIAPNGRATAPGPRGGCAPRPCRFALGGSPATCHQGEVFVKTMGGASAGRSEAEAGCWPVGNCLQLSMGQPRRGSVGARKPRPVFSFRVEDPQAWGWRSRPQAPQGSLSVGKCSESTYRRKWQNGGMAHFAILRCKLKSAVAVHRSMKHSFRAQDTPNADAS